MTTKREQKQAALQQVLDALDDTSIAICQSRPNTMARVHVIVGENEYEALGFSKVNWRDQWDSDTGIEIAVKKAIAKIVKAIVAGSECCDPALYVPGIASRLYPVSEPADAPTCGVTDCAQGFGMPCEACAGASD